MKKFLTAMIVCLAAPLALFAGELTVTGSGSVSLAADNAYVQLSVTTEATKPADALTMNSEATNRVFASLEKLGIKKSEIQTSNLRLNAKYNYPEKQEPKLVGYTVTHTILITVCNIPDTGKVLDTVVKDGANRIDGISFGLSQEKLRDATNIARKAAAKDAMDKVDLYSNVLSLKNKELKTFSEYSNQSGGRVAYAATAERAAPSGATNVEGGDITVKVQVTTTWDVK
jgi:hypothetical protein